MNCASCGRANRDGAKFCSGCGKPVAVRCSACGAECEPDAQFCDACGASLLGRPADATGARKVVTIVFADLVGSTSLHERLDAESVRRLMDRYYRTLHAAVEAHGGTVVKLLGDGVMAAFGVPRVAEDDAIRAVRAAVGMQEAFRGLVRTQTSVVGNLGLRVAVNTGEVVVSDDHADVVGDPVNVAAHLQEQAHDGDVLIGDSTRRLVGELVTLAPFGALALKGRSERVAAYRVVSLERPAGATATAFVGRDDELRRIRAVHEAAVAAPAARLVVILGSPGLGKSRLIDEFTRRLGDGATVLSAQCDAAGGATFAPLASALRTLLRIEDGSGGEAVRAAIVAAVPEGAEQVRIADGIAALLGGTPASPEETFFVIRRLLAALAAVRPVVLAIDDLQWAEPLLFDLVEHLVQWGAGVPLLVLAAARPELRDARSSLASPGGLVADVVTLAGLDAGAATRLAANVIGADALPAAVAGRVLATSEGNPLFLGELVRMLVNDGALRREGGRWTTAVELADLEMPPTIHALLAARIERLRPEERAVLERAAVVGRQFSRAAVAHLLPRELRADLDARLESLRRSELIEPDAGWFLGEPALRFHHVLIRDAAYRRLLKGTRAELHGRFADWLEARVGEAVEHHETIGWHLEQAHQHLRELGPIDEPGRILGERAARYLAAAGRRALARDDLPLASSLLGRALDRLDPADAARADLALDWCEALLAAGDVGPAANAIAELGRFTGGSDRLRAWHTCFAGQLAVLTDPQALRTTVDGVAAAADRLAAAGDAAGEAKAHSVHALALARLGKIGACEAALDRALAAARRAHDRRRANAVLAGAPLAALSGPSPVTRASGRCLDVVRVLRITQGAPAVEAVALRCQGVLEALRGRTDAARRMIASSRRMVEELGITQRLLEADVFAGQIELLEGDAVAAERCLRSAYDGLRDHGLGIDAAQAAALLGRALLAQGRAAEAEALSHESEALAGDDLKAAIAWRGVRAEALARRGEHASAVELARAAVEIAAATDALLDHADARLALAVALRAAGRRDEADAEDARAIELWEAKGATLLAERARRAGGRAAVADRAADGRPPLTRPVQRRVHANDATAVAARVVAAIAARNADALPALLADGMETVHHPTGVVYDRQGALASLRSLLRGRDPTFRLEPVAALGDSLALCRQSVSASATGGGKFDVGAYERDQISLLEVEARGRWRRAEVFAADRLGDAVVRLYERYADLLPDGPARTRAAATARSIATLLGSLDLDRYTAALASAVEFVDHRPLGFGPSRGAEALLRGLHSLLEVASDIALHDEDVLDLRSDLLLVRRTTSGMDRASGGAFERQFLNLWVFGSDGLVTRVEWFALDREDDALARIDELAAEPRPARFALTASHVAERRERRVRPNAATTNGARTDAAFATRDIDALAALLAEASEFVHHPTDTRYDRQAAVSQWRKMLRNEDPTLVHEPLAILGESLALCVRAATFSGVPRLDIGAVEAENSVLIEVDSRGRRLRSEVFAENRLGDAVARLYERYADLLPDGPERTRAAATARSVATHLGGPSDLDRIAADLTLRVDDILGLQSDAFLVRLTSSGIDRVGGGAYEKHLLALWVFGADGLVTRLEQFDVEREDEALARFDELSAEPLATRFANAASRSVDRFERCWHERDWDGVVASFAPGMRMDDRRALVRLQLEAEDFVANLRIVFSTPSSRWESELLATRGERLALLRGRHSGEPRGAGAFEHHQLSVVEVDAQGRHVAVVVFDPDGLAAAYTELDDRYAAGEGASYAELLAHLRAFAQAVSAGDRDAVARLLPDDFTMTSHRRFGGTGSPMSRDEVVASLSIVEGIGVRAAIRADHLLRISPSAFVGVNTWHGHVDGGDFESPIVTVAVHDGTRLRSVEVFDPDRLDAALARFDELSAARTTSLRIENAASRTGDRLLAAWAAHDWERLTTLIPAGVRHIDRQRTAQLDSDRDQYLDAFRPMFEMLSSAPTREVLGTRGDRLVLSRLHWVGSGDRVGPSEFEWLGALEVDDGGDLLALVDFDPDNLDAAYAELDDRYAAGEAAAHGPVVTRGRAFAQAIASRDWDAVAAQLAPDFVLVDHRPVGWETLRGPGAYVATLRSLVELAPDARLRLEHFRVSDRGALLVTTWVGTREGGAFETPKVIVSETDRPGRFHRFDTYDLDQLDAALARYAELGTAASGSRFENAATRHTDRIRDAWKGLDWERFAALHPADYRNVDRRKMMQIELGRSDFLETFRASFEMTSSPPTFDLLATRGDRLAMFRALWKGTDGLVGPSEVELNLIVEVEDGGNRLRTVMFNPDDLDAAYAELDERYADGEAGPYGREVVTRAFLGAFAARDWAALATLLAPDLVVSDHRLLGWETLRGPGPYVEALRSLVDLAPDVRLRLDHVIAMSGRRVLYAPRWLGTHEGGAFETPSFIVAELDGQGRFCRFDQYDLTQLDQARARFDAPGMGAARDALAALARPNAATAANARAQAAFDARDWAAMRAVCAPDARIEDRRRRALVSGDADWWIADARRMAQTVPNTRYERKLVATAGDRLDLEHAAWSGGPPGGEFTLESLWLTEVDERGRIIAVVAFDVDDWRAANAEGAARWLAADPAAAVLRPLLIEFGEGMNDHDRARIRAVLADDFVVHDHRRARLGRIEGADACLDTIAALWDLAPDIQYDFPIALAVERYGCVYAGRQFGTLTEGGAFENLLVSVAIVARGRITRFEYFELDDVDAALARFAELRPDPLRIPPNAATRTIDRFRDARAAGDWNALEALCARALLFDDRRRATLTTGGRDMLIAMSRFLGSQGARSTVTVLATSGDRLALEHARWTGPEGGIDFEVETLQVIEVDAEGRIVAGIAFDPDDRRAASAEMLDRYARSDAARSIPAAGFEGIRAMNDHDLERLRAVLPRDFVLHDHRHTGLGRLEGADRFIASLAALFEQARDSVVETLYTVATEKHGDLAMVHMFGTLANGGEFEGFYARLGLYRGDRIVGMELFEPEDLDVARARLEELRPDPLRIPPNAATRAMDRLRDARVAGGWEALEALCAPTLLFDDRRRATRTTGDRDLFITNNRFVGSRGTRSASTLLASSGDRLALEHVRWTGPQGRIDFEIEDLRVIEVDAEGRIVACIVFDPDDRRAAAAELFERYVRSDAARWIPARVLEWLRALHDRDLDRMRATLPDDFDFHDHRRTGAGRLVGADAYIAFVAALFEQSPDATIETLHIVAAEKHGALDVGRIFGTRADGGEFESIFVRLVLYDPDGGELFEPEDMEAARARFEELRPDPVRIPANAASRARDRTLAAFEAGDWQGLRSLASPDFVFDDRTRRSLVRGGVDLWIKSVQFLHSLPGMRIGRELIGTAGERIAIERNHYAGELDGGPVERENIRLTEIDADGRLVALINWDIDDRRAAFAEAQARFAAGEAAAAGGQQPIVACRLAMARWDWETVRGCVADDLAVRDHRTLGLSNLHRDDWIAWIQAQTELVPDTRVEAFRILAWSGHGRVELVRVSGTIPGGGPFENVFAGVIVTDGDRIRHLEFLDVADVEQALARFEELSSHLA